MDSEKKAMIDIESYDAVRNSEIPYPLKMLAEDGKTETGITFLVLGKNATVITDFNRVLVNGYINRNEMAKKRGKMAAAKTAEELREDGIAGCAIRVSGWQGVSNPFSQEVLKRALQRNPHWIDQVIECSDELGNYTGTPLKN